VGQTYGWHWGFGLATGGMLVGVALFVAPTRLTQLMLGGTVLATSIIMPMLQDSMLQLAVRLFMGLMLLTAGAVAVAALNRGGLPEWAGQPPSREALTRKVGGFLRADWTVYLGALVAIGLFTLIVQRNIVAGVILNITGVVAFGYIFYEAFFKCTKVDRDRLLVVLILAVFHTCFWAFFEQAGTSLNNWTDRNIDRVIEDRALTVKDVGSTIEMRIPLKVDPKTDAALVGLAVLTQEQLGQQNGDPSMKDTIEKAIRSEEARRNQKRLGDDKLKPADIDELVTAVRAHKLFTMTGLEYLRAAAGQKDAPAELKRIRWKVLPSNDGMGIGSSEIPASEFQAANPIYILLFGLLFSGLWTFLGRRGRDPSTPVKFALALAQLGIGFGIFWYGAKMADARGMSSMTFLLLGWMIITTGELCLSPVGLSMVTKMSPKRIVSTVMGAWFISITYANYVAAIIAGFTGVSHGGSKVQVIPPPQETAATYGRVFGIIAAIALGAAVVCFLLKWQINKWMHPEVTDDDAEDDAEDDAVEEAAATP
jgi:POT family proton-dependent oligopeptide transporter